MTSNAFLKLPIVNFNTLLCNGKLAVLMSVPLHIPTVPLQLFGFTAEEMIHKLKVPGETRVFGIQSEK